MTRTPAGVVPAALPLTVNCSILLTHLPLRERPRAVRDAGFDAVELWWPFATPTPDDADVDAFVACLDDAGVRLTGLNLAAGDMAAGDRGLVSWPGRDAELAANLDVVTAIGERTGCRSFNALYGNRQDGVDPRVQDDLAVDNLARAAHAVGRIGGTVLLEPLSGVAAYPLRTCGDVVGVLDRVADERGARNLGLLLDLYHLAVNGTDVADEIRRHRDRVAHVQVADAPGRGAPGTGTLPLADWLGDVAAGGYVGVVGLEYASDAADPFAWLPRERRGRPGAAR